MARALSEIGVVVVRHDTVGDDPELIARAMLDGLERTGAVITSGGLGPTADDRTRNGLAAAFGRELLTDPEALAQVERRFRLFGREMPKINVVQALVPRGARVLENRFGSAPALWMEDERGRWVVALPGVPSEMRGLLTETVIPILRAREGSAPTVVSSRTNRNTGNRKTAHTQLLREDGGDTVAGLPLAYLPGWEGVDLRVTAAEMPAAEAERRLDEAGLRLRERAGRYIYGLDAADLAAVVLDLCRERSLTIATAESCTGGLIGARLTAIPGSSDVFLGGVVAYANAVKESLLDVPAELIERRGAVSEEVARAMAAGARARLGADVGIGITGIAGPGGGSPQKPVGTVWIAAQVGDEVRTFGRVYIGDRGEVRSRSAQAALETVRQMLMEPR
jgi:nicotinamide-nucleotide amidase